MVTYYIRVTGFVAAVKQSATPGFIIEVRNSSQIQQMLHMIEIVMLDPFDQRNFVMLVEVFSYAPNTNDLTENFEQTANDEDASLWASRS
jgi:nicotinate-nucleotide pyrophosphorylase